MRNDFVRQFLPALSAGLVVFLLSYLIQKPPSNSGSLRYEQFENFIDVPKTDANGSIPDTLHSQIIRVYNFGDSDLSDFTLVISGVYESTYKKYPIEIDAEFRNVVAPVTIDRSRIGKDRVLRIPISKFSAGGELTLNMIGNSGSFSDVQTSKSDIDIQPLGYYTVGNRNSAYSMLTFLYISGVLSVLAAFSVYLLMTQRRKIG